MFALLIPLLLVPCLADCPLNPYPRRVQLGFLDVQLDNDPRLHASASDYAYPLASDLAEGGVSVAIGVVGVELNPRGSVDFGVEYVPSTAVTALGFRVQISDGNNGWRSLRFSFFASQSPLLLVGSYTVREFSTGLDNSKYAVYRPVPNFNNYQNEPAVRVFISGLSARAKPLDQEYNTMVSQYEGFRRFSTNAQLVTYFAQAIQIKKSIYFRISDARVTGRFLAFNIDTSALVQSLTFSYILFSRRNVQANHNFIIDDFALGTASEFKFNSLQNMDMLMTGLVGFRFARDSQHAFSLALSDLGGQSVYTLLNSFRYLDMFFSYVGFDMKLPFVCQDCPNSPIIYDNRFCVGQCPRAFSLSQSSGIKFCDKCQIQKLKVVDPETGMCVCARRHYLEANLDSCRPCSYDCMTCNSASRCLTCDNTQLQTKRKLNSSGRCECPTTGFYDDKSTENIICQKCDPGCLTCNGPKPNDCLTCVASKQLDGRGFCTCRNGFVADASGGCICAPPRRILNGICVDNTNTPCGANKVQQFVDLTRRCVCRVGFQAVLEDCIQCRGNSTFNQQTLKCQCIRPYVEVNGQCRPCGVNEIYDDLLRLCVCAQGSFKTELGACVRCPPKMALFDDKCECIYNYFEARQGVCQRCVRETDGPRCKRNIF